MSAEGSGGHSVHPAPGSSLSTAHIPPATADIAPDVPQLGGALSAAQVADIDKLFDSFVTHYNDTPPQPAPSGGHNVQPGTVL